MKYTKNDLYEGMKLRCISTMEPHWWNVGKQYEVEKSTDGLFILKDEKGYIWNRWLILDFLNGKAHCKMEIVEEEKEMKYTEKDIKECTKLRCTKGRPSWWTVGKLYNVSLNDDGILQITDDNGHCAYPDYMLDCLNGKHNPVSFEIVEEEKEMKKYAKITKYAGFNDIDKRNGLKIGKTYKIVNFSPVSEDCYIYLNEEHPSYFISEIQYELVEKEVPTLKANVNVDVKEAIQAKIDALTTEAERLFTKRDRLEQHAINLNAKARKLEEVLETIKEFE